MFIVRSGHSIYFASEVVLHVGDRFSLDARWCHVCVFTVSVSIEKACHATKVDEGVGRRGGFLLVLGGVIG